MKTTPKGFTLIELMIVVAIIGILAAVALPAYQDYTKRAHVSEALSMMSTAKTAITEFYANNGRWPVNNTSAGIADANNITGNAVTSVTVATSLITTVLNSKVTTDTAHNQICLKGKDEGGTRGSVIWTCKAAENNNCTTVLGKYLPASCR